MGILLTMAMTYILTASSNIIDASSFNSIIETITAQVSVANVVGILASVVAICIGFTFFWWGIRKVIRMIMIAFKSGKTVV